MIKMHHGYHSQAVWDLWLMVAVGIFCVPLDLLAQTWGPHWDSVARAVEKQFGNPHGITRAIIRQESNLQSYSFRCEPSYIDPGGRYYAQNRSNARTFKKLHGIGGLPSQRTEEVQCGTSWTEGQLLGTVLRYELGYSGLFMTEITRELAFFYINKFIWILRGRWPGSQWDFIAAYNGGGGAIYSTRRGRKPVRRAVYGNNSYVQSVLGYLKQYAY